MMKNILRLVASSRIRLDIHLVRKITDKKTSNFKFSTSLSVLFSGSSYSYNIFSQCPTLSLISFVPLSFPSCSLSFFFPLPLMTSILFTSLLSALLPLPSPPYSHPFSFSPHSQVLRNIALYHIILYPQLSLSIIRSLPSPSPVPSPSTSPSLVIPSTSLFLYSFTSSPYSLTLTLYSFTLTPYSFTLNPYSFTFSRLIASPSLLIPLPSLHIPSISILISSPSLTLLLQPHSIFLHPHTIFLHPHSLFLPRNVSNSIKMLKD